MKQSAPIPHRYVITRMAIDIGPGGNVDVSLSGSPLNICDVGLHAVPNFLRYAADVMQAAPDAPDATGD